MPKKKFIVDSSRVEAALLEVDMDSAAERLIVVDRLTGECLVCCRRPPSGIAKNILPLKHAIGSPLMVSILDDDGQYNAKTVDGVLAERVFVSAVNMSQ